MTQAAAGNRTLLRLALAWSVGTVALLVLGHLVFPAIEFLGLLFLPYAGLILAVCFTLYEFAMVPRPFAPRALALFDGVLILSAGVGWILFRALTNYPTIPMNPEVMRILLRCCSGGPP